MSTTESWAVWVGTGAAILAAFVPAVLFFFERRDRKSAQAQADQAREREIAAAERRLEQDAEDRRLAQARRVAITRRTEGTEITVYNRSDLPLYGVGLVNIQMPEPPFTQRLAVLLGSREGMAPGETWTSWFDRGEARQDLWVRFMDAEGRMWLRDIRGELTTVHEMLDRWGGAGIHAQAELLMKPPGSPGADPFAR